ncbi:MAG: type II toxin-antitoxin system VapC family toxin [Acidimicrobiales bacterium]|nr:type II toxin-antitoxin system VapC family toxin [Acidimicrobiales bacterium]MYB82721.1 type II toxin-antitoxin system VapC family toxin [Acidimicrobiales bacterium]MYI13358.1 type II toxin-antitoxin system VapC family toxin [Acidimicrobiales bacterium]MYJ47720.1 type II toxin-antitoxin system VapC family toxin [Acidimicrobiales bacterium]
MTVVLDASAMLAVLADENGARTVEEALLGHTRCSAANWSEAAQIVMSKGRSWAAARAYFSSCGLQVEPVTQADAEWAARRWRSGEGLSLADRLCMALGERLDAQILTADRSWGSKGRITQIR